MGVSIKSNILFNFAGRFWSVLATVAFIPLYIKLLGIESYAVISFTLVLGAVMSVLDSGLSATLAREFAYSKNSLSDKQNVFQSLESLYFVVAAASVLVLFLSSEFIANNWLKADGLESFTTTLCIKLISFEIGLRLLCNFYLGGFLGLDLHAKSNLFQIGYSIVRSGLVLAPLYIYPSLQFFFYWQLVSTFIYVIFLRIALFKALYIDIQHFLHIPVIRKEVISKVWKFAGGMMLISIVAAINTQLDKIVLSALLPIEILGVYSLSFSLANGLLLMCSPVATALIPTMTFLSKPDSRDEIVRVYLRGQKVISVLLFSGFAVLAAFAKEVLFIWTNDTVLADRAHDYLPWLALGATFLGLQVLPFNLAIANGFTRLNNLLGLISLSLTIPGYLYLVQIYNGLGATWTFAIVQLIIGLVYIYYMNKKFLDINFSLLFATLITLPLLLSVTLAYVAKFFIFQSGSKLMMTLEIFIVGLVILMVNVVFLFPSDVKRVMHKMKHYES